MTDTERAEYFAKELEWVAERLRAGRAGEQEIESLVNVISTIRATTPATNPEEEIVARYRDAKTAETVASGELAAHFWPLVKAATTQAEAEAILNRVPSVVEKVFFIDHFVYVSKVIPKVVPVRTEAEIVARYENAKKVEAEAAAAVEEFFIPLFREVQNIAGNGGFVSGEIAARVPEPIRSRAFFRSYIQERLEGMK